MSKLIKLSGLVFATVISILLLCTNTSAASNPVTWNPADKASNTILSNGNLTAVSDAGDKNSTRATEGKVSGKYYWEVKVDSIGSNNCMGIGIAGKGFPLFAVYDTPDSLFYYPTGSEVYSQTVVKSALATYRTNDIIGIALNIDNKQISFYKNGVLQDTNSYSNYVTSSEIFPLILLNCSSKATANFGATAFAYPVPSGYAPYESNTNVSPAIDVTSLDTVKSGSQFTTDIVLKNVTNICAEDIRITYDTTKFAYVGTQDVTGLKIYSSTETTPGALRFIVASLGKDNAANGEKVVLKLVFKAISSGKGKIDVIKGRIADNATLEMDVAEENCGEKLITVQAGDVNRTGDFTLLDLAIDAWYYSEPVANTDTTKYDADINNDGNIDDLDLSTIVDELMKNTNYQPNN